MRDKGKTNPVRFSEDRCNKALAAIWPAGYQGNPENWKRVHKVDGDNGALVRIYGHRERPILGSVVEADGKVTANVQVILADSESRS